MGRCRRVVTRLAVVDRLIEVLRRHGIRDAVGFVNGDRSLTRHNTVSSWSAGSPQVTGSVITRSVTSTSIGPDRMHSSLMSSAMSR
jgi:hypothetical protein